MKKIIIELEDIQYERLMKACEKEYLEEYGYDQDEIDDMGDTIINETILGFVSHITEPPHDKSSAMTSYNSIAWNINRLEKDQHDIVEQQLDK